MYKRLHDETSIDENSLKESKTETIDITTGPSPVSYGSIPVQDQAVHRFYVPFCGLIFYVMAFFGLFCVLSLRETLSVAIVAKVNKTTITETDIAMTNVSDRDKCPKDPEVGLKSGELNWARGQVAIVLAAFYYGFVFTPVRSFTLLYLFTACSLTTSVFSVTNFKNFHCQIPEEILYTQIMKILHFAFNVFLRYLVKLDN